jgi:hypothetical protein
LGSWGFQRVSHFQGEMRNGYMGKGEMGTVRAGKPPSLPRELRTPLVLTQAIHNTRKVVKHYALFREPGGLGEPDFMSLSQNTRINNHVFSLREARLTFVGGAGVRTFPPNVPFL